MRSAGCIVNDIFDKDFDKKDYKKFLKSISYIVEEKNDFKIETENVDKEISSIA